MILRAAAAIVGVLGVGAGLALSPVPWVALVWVFGALLVFGLLSDVKEAE